MTKILKFKECLTCVNREYDPFQCQGCVKASNYEAEELGEEIYEEYDYDEFRDIYFGDRE